MKNKLALLMLLPLSNLVLAAEQERSYMLLERSKPTESGLQISSLGAFGFANNKFTHISLSYLDSPTDGKGLAADIGIGISYKFGVNFFAGAGYVFGYNPGQSDLISAYYPETGIAIEITRKLGLVISGKQIRNLYNQSENVLLFGLLLSDR